MKFSEFGNVITEQRRYFEEYYETQVNRSRAAVLVTNPSIRAASLFHLCAKSGRWHFLWRNLLIMLHSCDVSRNAVLEGPLLVPHPIGIVIGKSAVIGERAVLYQGVTVGAGPGALYPTIGAGAVLYAHSTVVGNVFVPANSRVKAHHVISPGAKG